MGHLAIAVDYDGTIATHDRISAAAAAALERLRASGRRAILVTASRLQELLVVCPEIGLFDCVVAENGGVLYDPRSREERLASEPSASSGGAISRRHSRARSSAVWSSRVIRCLNRA
jgi:hydroxymethylpyrimidine pyrophosphatase-like HAD family hydrolase